MFHYQLTQLDQTIDDCIQRYRQRTDWDGAVIVGKRFCTLTLWRKRELFDLGEGI
jgi:hypothetical protein